MRIGRFTNLQDHVMVHVGYHKPTIVGDYCSITHRVVLHGCTIGDNCLIGIGATIMEGAVIGENSIVAGHSFVADNTIVPPNSIVMGTPAKVVRTVNSFVANRDQRHALLPQRACATPAASIAPGTAPSSRPSSGAGRAMRSLNLPPDTAAERNGRAKSSQFFGALADGG